MQAQSYYRAKKFLTEDVIIAELLSDNLSAVPDGYVIINKERIIMRPLRI
jgi:hypothetical protein